VGVATLFKYQAAFWGPALAVAVVLAGAGRPGTALRPLALLAAAFLLPPLASWAVLARLGAGDAFVYWNWTHNLAYSATPCRPARRRACRGVPASFPPRHPPAVVGGLALAPRLGRQAAALVASLLAFSSLAALLGLRLYPTT